MARVTLNPDDLAVVAVKANMTGTATIDPYIPLKLEFPAGVGAIATVIVRSEDSRSLIDLGIDMSTGRLTRATLVMTPVIDDQIMTAISNAVIRHGIPCLATAKFDADSFAPSGEIVTVLRMADNEDKVAVIWGDHLPDAKMLTGEGFLLLHQNAIIGFGAERPVIQ